MGTERRESVATLTRVAFACRGSEGLTALVDPQFGRAQHFCVVDAATDELLDQWQNPSASAAQGAGTGAAGELAEREVQAVIAGRFGPKAYQALERLGIAMYLLRGDRTVAEALGALRDGTLEQMQLAVY